MIKTLRITSYLAVVLAVVFFAFPAVFGVRGDKRVEQFLNSAGAIEEFRAARGDKIQSNRNETSPLVKQAEAFALYLNPPPKPKPKPPVAEARSNPRPAGPVTAKFKLVGTSRHVLHPELSLALIDEPGKGLYWVRQSSTVGHLIIEQVRDGLIVVRDGSNTFELVADRPEKRSLVKATLSPDGRITDGKPQETNAAVQMGGKAAALSEDREKALAELDAMLLEHGITPPDEANLAPKTKTVETAKKTVSDLENMRISAREAKGLGRLGRRLRSIQREPNRVRENGAESDANLIESNLKRLELGEPGLNDANVPG